MKATKLPSGNWRVQAYVGTDDDGRKIMRSFTDPNKKTAMLLAMEYIDQHKATSTTATFGAASKAFLRSVQSNKSPSTYRGYTSLDRMLESRFTSFYNSRISSITDHDMKRIVDRLKADGKSPKTITNYCFYITAVCKTKKVKIDCSDIIPSKKRPHYHIPTSDQVREILAYAREKDEELWVCLALAAFAPLRASEISALRYRYNEDIDFKNNTIHVTHALVAGSGYKYVLKEPKTESSNRIITMPEEVMSVIKERGYVTNYTPIQIYKKFKRLTRDLGITDIRLHDLRHYCASMLHAKGYPDIYIQARTGHSTLEVLRQVYTHALDDERKRMEERMIADFNNLL